MIKWFTFFILCTYCSALSTVILSEVFADPSFLSDNQAEFVEIINLGDRPSSFKLIYHQDTLLIVNVKEGLPILICRDSITLASVGIGCFANWPNLTLNNSDSLYFSIYTNSDSLYFTVPPAKSGKSWENYYQNHTQKSQWILSPQASTLLQGDFGSPFALPFDSLFLYNNNLKLDSIYIGNVSNSIIQFSLVIQNIGKSRSLPFEVKTTLYKNGIVNTGFILNTYNESTSISLQSKHLVHLDFPKVNQGLFLFELSNDDFNANNSKTFFYTDQPPIIISEVCPSPVEGDPEWFEITNIDDEMFYLTFINYNQTPLSSTQSVKPQESIIITNDKIQLEYLLNGLNLTIIQPPSWDILNNSGDSIILSFKHPLSHVITLDSMSYPSIKTTQKNNCWIKNNQNEWVSVTKQYRSVSSPGFIAPVSNNLTWSINSKIIRTDRREKLNVQIISTLGKIVTVKIFDFKGHLIETLCHNCSGSFSLIWNDTPHHLPSGPYLLWIKEQQQNPIKVPIVLMKKF